MFMWKVSSRTPTRERSGIRGQRRRLRRGVHHVGLEAVDRLDAEGHVVAFEIGIERRERFRRPLRPFRLVGGVEDAPRRIDDPGEPVRTHGGGGPQRPSQVLDSGRAHLGVGRGDVGLARESVRAGHLQAVIPRQPSERRRLLVRHAEQRDLDPVETQVGHRPRRSGRYRPSSAPSTIRSEFRTSSSLPLVLEHPERRGRQADRDRLALDDVLRVVGVREHLDQNAAHFEPQPGLRTQVESSTARGPRGDSRRSRPLPPGRSPDGR